MAYYVILEGHNPGVYSYSYNWEKEIEGYKNPVFRTFDRETDALEYMTKGGEVQNVFVDGAMYRNFYSENAGFGVYYGPGDTRNTSSPASYNIQYAELAGLVHTLKNVNQELMDGTAKRPVRILTDSEYSVPCFNQWCNKWRRNGWKTARGNTIGNVNLLQEMVNLKDSINSHYASKGWSNIKVVKVKGVNGNLAYKEADSLARLGASRDAPFDDYEAEFESFCDDSS
ncbi:uncharacterized protein J8A68_002316 [[Candida] subhashii]|uniref:RNase H type-1 domain-containing protein n=1 Tax=[Candida] subhashii TaxID=561895 RepID=A0A8J5QPP9_9ASCO|nr:uncharacterized protein J8A68_002316 [[Candida] subhashii]KAG7664133.1 hypothetical protein J8A68_002316 [[Candida] subhashii]